MVITNNPKPIDRTSWVTVAARGLAQDVLGFLSTENLRDLQLDLIGWRAGDRDFCMEVTDVLRKRGIFTPVLWSYGFLHVLPRLMKEYLEHEIQFINGLGYELRSPLLDVKADEDGKFEYLDYYPLVNARGGYS